MSQQYWIFIFYLFPHLFPLFLVIYEFYIWGALNLTIDLANQGLNLSPTLRTILSSYTINNLSRITVYLIIILRELN
ncbi:hypothetical protein HanIR_Chr17g0892191 [Helianthus annuus]|nr:hypothetical protein HanIR_Chr17g0892191 [Helianthus annuus]